MKVISLKLAKEMAEVLDCVKLAEEGRVNKVFQINNKTYICIASRWCNGLEAVCLQEIKIRENEEEGVIIKCNNNIYITIEKKIWLEPKAEEEQLQLFV